MAHDETKPNPHEDVSLALAVGAAYARLAEAVEARGGSGKVLREDGLRFLKDTRIGRRDLWPLRVMEGKLLETMGRFEDAADAYDRARRQDRLDDALRVRFLRAHVAAAVVAACADPAGVAIPEPSPRAVSRNAATRRMAGRPKSARVPRIGRAATLPTSA